MVARGSSSAQISGSSASLRYRFWASTVRLRLDARSAARAWTPPAAEYNAAWAHSDSGDTVPSRVGVNGPLSPCAAVAGVVGRIGTWTNAGTASPSDSYTP